MNRSLKVRPAPGTRQPYRKPAPDAPDTLLRAAVLEIQGELYRTFHLASGRLIHSHFCKTEVIRRTERDGFMLRVLPA